MSSRDALDEPDLLAQLRETLAAPEIRFVLTWALGPQGRMDGVRVEYRRGTGPWRKHPVSIYTSPGQTLGELLAMLAELREEVCGG